MQSIYLLEGNAKTDEVGFVFIGAQVAERGLAVEGQAAPTAAANHAAPVFFLAKQGVVASALQIRVYILWFQQTARDPHLHSIGFRYFSACFDIFRSGNPK